MDNLSGLDRLAAEFREKYDAFAEGCEAADADGRWKTDEDGPMEGYAFGAMAGAILSLIVADGNVGEHETEYLNRTFGFAYTVDDLLGLYRFSAGDIRQNAVENVEDAAERIRLADPALAGQFRALMTLACRILSESDDGVLTVEKDVIRSITDAMKED